MGRWLNPSMHLQGQEHAAAASAACAWMAGLMQQHLAAAPGSETIRLTLPESASLVWS